ncbi:sigma-54 interaction domain-containing protein [Brevibacillus fluminis]|uniref:sigma-54 interaction domain-containing protein n=1 Tax=Brevibacillus fluminis TaxID=511487 RepID=UPI003F8B2264
MKSAFPADRPASDPSWTGLPTVPVDAALTAAAEMFGASEELLVVNARHDIIGYLTKTDTLAAIASAYQYLEAYFDTIISTVEESISVIDENANIIVWTEGAENIFSVAAADAIGKPITDFFPVDMLMTLKTLQTGESVYRKQHQPREDLFVLINSNPIRLHDRIIGSVAVETDVTSQVRLNQELYHATSKVHSLQQEVAKLSPSADPFYNIKGSSLVIKKITEKIKKVASTKATVLFLGESGVGKELFARATHDIRENPDAPFIAINCGAIAPTLFESELFGYEKGAFSGADQKGKKGMIELARGGTLFLDEVGEMPLDMQVKLLRVLQEKKYYPVGGTKQVEADFRVIAATNKDLAELVKQGQFREDLYYRLNVVTIKIPPLRERIEDIIELCHFFLYEFSMRYNRPINSISQTVMQEMLAYQWPGNIRELRNTVERLVVFATDGIIKEEDLTFPQQAKQKTYASLLPDELINLQQELDVHEKKVILHALELEKGNKLAAAKRLGISRATLYNKMSKLNIPVT